MSNPSVQNPAPVKATMRRITPNRGAAVAAIKTGVVEAPGGVQVESITGHGPATDLQAELLEQDAPIDVQATPMAPNGVTEQSTAVAVVSQSANAVAEHGRFYDASAGALEGEFDSSDIKHPQLKIVQGSGPLSAMYSSGTLILGDEELLPPPNLKDPSKDQVLRVVPIHMLKQFRENLSQDDYQNGQMPRMAGSIAEVESLGGTTQWIGQQKPSWSPSARILFLIQQPDGSSHPGFAFELDGKFYAPAVYFAAGTGWTRVAKTIFSVAQTSLFEGKGAERRQILHKCIWTWQVKKIQAGQNMVYAPEMRVQPREITGPELRDFVAQMKGQTDAVAAE